MDFSQFAMMADPKIRDREIRQRMLEKPGFYVACQKADGSPLGNFFPEGAERRFSRRRNAVGSINSTEESESAYLVIYQVLDERRNRDHCLPWVMGLGAGDFFDPPDYDVYLREARV